MKNLILVLFLLMLTSSLLQAQTGDEKHSRFQLSFVPPLSTNGWEASRYTNDVSFNILAGISKSERGFALASLANVILEEANGFQMAGITNIAGGNGYGFMSAGVLNTVADYSGFQLAGIGNVARNVNGIQLGGIFNKAASVRGTQLGMINIADNNDYPIGLINIIRNGEMSIGISYNETGENLYSFRSGGRILYGIVGVGFNHKLKKEKFLTEFGLGAHIPVKEWFRIDQELKTVSSYSKDQLYHYSYSLLPAFRILPNLELTAGPSLNFLHTNDPDKEYIFHSRSLWKKFNTDGLKQLYIGYTVGVHFIF